MTTPISTPSGVHNALLDAPVVDALLFRGDGWTPQLAESGLSLVHVTAADFLLDFEDSCDEIMRWWEVLERDRDYLRPVIDQGGLADVRPGRRMGVILGLQNAALIGESPERVELLWKLGIRVLQLTYNTGNLLGDGCGELRDAGLTSLGRTVVRECNRSGMVIDLSHVGPQTSLDAVEASSHPVVATHVNRRAVAPSLRNKSDDVLRSIVDSGGVIGVCPHCLMSWSGRPGDRPTLESFVGLVLDMVDFLGEDAVGIGSDMAALNDSSFVQAKLTRGASLFPEIYDPFVAEFGDTQSTRYPVDFESVDRWKAVPEALLSAGLSESATRKVLGANWIRVFGDIWSRRGRLV